MQLLYDEGEAAAGAVHAEEEHGHVLRGAAAGPGALGGAVVRVALVERQRVVLPAGELLPLQNPAVKYLGEENRQCFSSEMRFLISEDSVVSLQYPHLSRKDLGASSCHRTTKT